MHALKNELTNEIFATLLLHNVINMMQQLHMIDNFISKQKTSEVKEQL